MKAPRRSHAVVGGSLRPPHAALPARRTSPGFVGPQTTRSAGAAAARTGVKYELEHYDLGGERYLRTGDELPDTVLEELRGFDAIYLGAVGHPEVAPGILEKNLLLRIRFELDQYINLRPVKLYPGVETPLAGKGPEEIDFIIVRENTEGLYSGMGGIQYKGTPQEVSTQVHMTTRFGAERAGLRAALTSWGADRRLARARGHAMALLAALAESNRAGEGGRTSARLRDDIGTDAGALDPVLARLDAARYVTTTVDGRHILARDLDHVDLHDLLRDLGLEIGPEDIADGVGAAAPWRAPAMALLDAARRARHAGLDASLAALLDDSTRAEKPEQIREP